MRMVSIRVVVFFFAVIGSFRAVFSAKACRGTAKYVISFYSDWSNTTHPNAFPIDGHFSPLIGCSHGSNYTIFSSSIKATPGVKEVAELGVKTTMVSEINDKIKNDRMAWNLFQDDALLYPPNKTADFEFQVTSDFPLVSAITMIAPSPDWFVGIQSYNLCGADGRWITNHNMTDLQPWDAGTEDGTTFSLENSATDPTVNIFQITKDMETPFKGAKSIPSLGRISLRRIDAPSLTSCSGEAKYHLKFDALWSESTHPTGFPSDPHFSPLIGATHTSSYKFWSEYVRASPGVKKVAETGNSSILETEIKSKMSEYVDTVIKTSGPIDSPGNETVNITVKDAYSMVSVISMIAPSPDWFVGVDSLDLCGDNGKWKDSVVVNLPAWDAGTDSGQNFTSPDDPTDPVDVVRLITKDSDTILKGSTTIPFFGKFTLTRFGSDSEPTTKPTDSGTASAAAQLAIISISVFQVVALRAIL